MSIVLIAMLLAADPPFKAPKDIDLGGPRKVTVTITLDGDDYLLRTRMLPVSCFDDTTNARLNQQQGRLLALGALGRALGEKKNVELTVSGARIVEQERDGKFYVLRLRVPRTGIALVQTSKPAATPTAKKVERVAPISDLLTRKRDHEVTLERLVENLRADLAEAVAQYEKSRDAEALALVIAALEERGLDNLKRLTGVIRDDMLLLFTERDELLEAVARQRKVVLAALKRAVPVEDR